MRTYTKRDLYMNLLRRIVFSEQPSEPNFELIDRVLNRALSSTEESVIRLRYGLDGHYPLTQNSVGERIRNLTASRVSQIENKALHKLRLPTWNAQLTGSRQQSCDSEAELSARAYKRLKDNFGTTDTYGITKLLPQEVAKHSEAELWKVGGLGRKSLNEIKEWLASYGLGLGMRPL